jgi:hypothetical protein
MRAYKSDSQVQKHGCMALANIALEDSNHAAIGQKGGVHAIITALKANKNVPEVLMQGFAALCTLATNAENLYTRRLHPYGHCHLRVGFFFYIHAYF